MPQKNAKHSSLGINVEEFVLGTDTDELKPLRAEMALGIKFNKKLTPKQRKAVKARVERVLRDMLNEGSLFTADLRLPDSTQILCRDLPVKCTKCKAVLASPFFLR